MNIWHKINPKRITPDDFVAVVEIPKGSKNKYELDKETGLIQLYVLKLIICKPRKSFWLDFTI